MITNGVIVIRRNSSTLPRAALVGLEKKIEPAIDTRMQASPHAPGRLGIDEPGERGGFREPGVGAHAPVIGRSVPRQTVRPNAAVVERGGEALSTDHEGSR